MGQNIARQLEGRVSFRRAVKTAVASTMRMGAEGIKVQVAGRVGGAEMARTETIKEGRIPLHTFRADIDYCLTEALTKVGILGVKVWICQGTVYGKRDLFEIAGASAQAAWATAASAATAGSVAAGTVVAATARADVAGTVATTISSKDLFKAELTCYSRKDQI